VTSRIAGTGSFLPERKITNFDLEKRVDTSDAWIVARTGIRERGIAAPEDATSDLCTRAARRALASAGLAPDDLNLRVGRPIPAFDFGAACSGFIYGLEIVDAMLATGRYRRALLVGAETLTRFTDYEDRGTCVLFGDAAGAVILEASSEPYGGLRATRLSCDGDFWDLIHIPGGGSRRPASPYMLAHRDQYIQMNGRQVFKLAVQALEQVIRDVIDRAGWKLHDVDHFLVHQANGRIVEAVGERLGIPPERVPLNIDRTGNSSAASIPVLLDEQHRAGRLRPGDRIVCSAFGAGLTWGGAALEWTLV
jgi:3-oxoacyl-[acyl-carrier-protein] synthase-3